MSSKLTQYQAQRFNIQNYKESIFAYFTILTNIYLMNVLNSPNVKNTINKILTDHFDIFNEDKIALNNLLSSLKSGNEKLNDQSNQIQSWHIDKVFDEDEEILNSLSRYLTELFNKKSNNVSKLINDNQLKMKEIAILLSIYMNEDLLIKCIEDMSMPIPLSIEEYNKSPNEWSNILMLDTKFVKNIIDNIARQTVEEISTEVFSFIYQGDSMLRIVKDNLKEIVLKNYPYMSDVIDGFLDSPSVKRVIQLLSTAIDDHVAAKDASNNSQLNLLEADLGNIVSELSAEFDALDKLKTANNILEEKKVIIQQIKKQIKRCNSLPNINLYNLLAHDKALKVLLEEELKV